ncbi:MAG: zf-HC2 domain-containing protein [Sedimentisphaerales bacterium]|nr:zf-HC2 domain-containing protein [Sedimentisphaerales bacterium]
MKCLNDIEIMEFISDKLDAERKAEVQEHLASCSECSQRVQESSTLWDTLGQWEVDIASHNIADKVIAKIEKSESTRKHPKFFARHEFLMDALKIAASIIIAIGIGQKLGKISAGEKPPAIASNQESPEYIAALGLDWAGDFTWLVMEEDSSSQENE